MIVAYTAIFGESDSLKQAPPADRAICFTDVPPAHYLGWEIVRHEHAGRPRVAARILKMTPHLLFPDAVGSVWVDGSIKITNWQLLMWDAQPHEIACLAHPDRSSCYDEGRTVIRLERANPSSVGDALELYRAEHFEPETLSTTGLLYRKHTHRVQSFNEMWRQHLDRYGINDQVHIDYCAWKTGVPIGYLQGHYRDNPYAAYDRADHHARRKPQFNPGDRCEHYLA